MILLQKYLEQIKLTQALISDSLFYKSKKVKCLLIVGLLQSLEPEEHVQTREAAVTHGAAVCPAAAGLAEF